MLFLLWMLNMPRCKVGIFWCTGVIWLDVLPDATNNSHWCQLELNQGSLEKSDGLITWAVEPWLESHTHALITNFWLCVQHAEYQTVLRLLSNHLSNWPHVRLSNAHIVPKWIRTSSLFEVLVQASFVFFSPQLLFKISMGSPSMAALYPEWENFVIFDRNHRLSRKWYEIGHWLLLIINRKSQ